MGEKKTKIVLDADVINHFVRGGKLSLLPRIFPEFQYIVLDVVKKELPMLILSELIKQIYAIQRGLLKKEEAEDFIRIVISMGSNPPIVDFDQYICSKI